MKGSGSISDTGVINFSINGIKLPMRLTSFAKFQTNDYRCVVHSKGSHYLVRLHIMNDMTVGTVYDEFDVPVDRKILYKALFADVDKALYKTN